jgi:hypothetical protein
VSPSSNRSHSKPSSSSIAMPAYARSALQRPSIRSRWPRQPAALDWRLALLRLDIAERRHTYGLSILRPSPEPGDNGPLRSPS